MKMQPDEPDFAMFFAAKAMLLRKNIVTKTHRGLFSAFGPEYVQKNIVDAEYGRILSIAEELREEVLLFCYTDYQS